MIDRSKALSILCVIAGPLFQFVVFIPPSNLITLCGKREFIALLVLSLWNGAVCRGL